MVSTRKSVKKEPVDHPALQSSVENYPLCAAYNADDTNMDIPVDHVDHQPLSSGSTVRNDDVDMVNSLKHTNGTTTSPQDTASTTSNFTQGPRQLIKTIQKISALDIDATLPSLPKIVVVGDQSHGKSSVIEAMCGISLPRDAGTCTRCPFEIVTTASDSDWKCVISLKHMYDSVNKSWPLAKEMIMTDFAVVCDPVDLDHNLRLAQIAILSPDKRPSDIRLKNDVHVKPTFGFCPNIVHLHIQGRDMTELALYDLPGAINITERQEDHHYVGFVRRLLENYVKEDKAIILLAAAANADIELCNAFNIIRDQNAGDRALGVITKPDLADAAMVKRLAEVFAGEKWKLGQGWFATKQLSQEDLSSGNVTRQRARELEQAMFTRPPWSGLKFPGRFGIQNLQDALSQKLTAHILESLPVINQRVENRLKEVNDELAQFPEQTQAPCLEVIHEVHQITTAIAAKIQGGGLNNKFCEEYSDVMKELKKAFNTDAPELNMTTPGYKNPSISVESDYDDEDADEDENYAGSTARSSPLVTPNRNKSRKSNNGTPIATPTPNRKGQTLPHRTPTKGTPMKKGSNAQYGPGITKAIFTIENVRRRYELGSTSGLPDNLSPQVTEYIVRECLQGVHVRVNDTLKEVYDLMKDTLRSDIQTSLTSRAGTALVSEATKIVHAFFKTLFSDEEKLINSMIAAELHKPVVSDWLVHKDKKEKKRESLQASRTMRRVNEYFDTRDSRTGKNTAREERKKHAENPTWLANNLRTDEHADMVEAMAGPFVYYEMASRRVMDVVKLRMEYGVFRALREEVREVLMRDLRVVEVDHCAWLLAEDAGRERRRMELRAEKGRLEKAMVELEACKDV